MTMKKDVTLGNLISIAVTLFVLVLGWGISMTSRMDVSDNKIENNRENIINNTEQIEKVDDKMDKNFKIIQDKLDRILYRSLKD
jgi:hypothetical protein